MTRNIENIFGGIVTAPHQIPFTYTATGGEQSISLPFYPVSGVLTINGGVQVPVNNYEIDGNNINLGAALESGDVVYCLFDKILSPDDNPDSIRLFKFLSIGGETSFTPDFSSYGVRSLFIDGKFKVPGEDYTYNPVSGVVSLNTPLTSGVWVAADMTVKEYNSSLANRIDEIYGNARELWRRSLAEAGLNLVDGSFQEGGVLTTATDVIWDVKGNQCYKWGGTLPKTVSQGSQPSDDTVGWSNVSQVLLRKSLRDAMGAGLVGYNTTTVATALDSIITHNGRVVFLDDFPNVKGDGVTDDTAAIQAAILQVAIDGGATILGSKGKTYYIKGTILFCSDILIDFRWAKVKGERVTSTLPTFETATLSGTNTLVTNIGTSDEATNLVYNAGFINARISNCYMFLHANKFIKGCRLENIDGYNNRQLISGHWCFYSSYINILTRGGTDPAVPVMQFSGQNNSILFERVSITGEYGWQFTGGTTAVTFNACTFEGGSVAFDFQDDCNGISIDGGYFEAIPGVVFRFLNAGTCNVSWKGNYINLVDVVIQGGALPTSFIFGNWDKSNSIVRVGETDNGHLYTGIISLDDAHNFIDFELREDINNTSGVLPTNVHTSPSSNAKQIQVLEATGPGDVFAKAMVMGNGVIPGFYSGNPGKLVTNVVPFCTHSGSASGSNLVINVDSKILISEALFAKFYFKLTTSAGTYLVFGDVFGNQIHRADPNSGIVTIAASNTGGGYLRLVITVPNANTTYTCSGPFRMV